MHHAWLVAGRQGIGKATLAYRFARAALAHPSERAASGREPRGRRQTRALPARCARCRIRACSCCAAPMTRRAKRFAASIPVDEVRRLRSFLSHRARRGGLARRHRRCGRRAQRQRRQRAAEVAGGAAGARRVPADLVRAGPAACRPSARAAARSSLQPLAAADLRAAATQAFEASGRCGAGCGGDGRRSSDWRRAASARLLSLQGAGGLELNERVEASWRACRASTGAPCTRSPMSCSRWPRRAALRAVLRASARLCSAAWSALRRAGRGPGKTGNGRAADRRGAGLPRSPGCGKELAARRPRRWRSTSTARL